VDRAATGPLDDGRAYFVMDYIEGCRIDEFLDQQKLGVNETLRLFEKVCAEVQYAHRNFVVHRDLKPGNILVNAEGEPGCRTLGLRNSIRRDAGGQRGYASV
jgi:serine/threonine protein kinase